MIDTLRVAKTLQSGGFTSIQAEVIARVIASTIGQSSDVVFPATPLSKTAAIKLNLRVDVIAMKWEVIRWWLISQVMVLVALTFLPSFTIFG